jgi:hypothetical protein
MKKTILALITHILCFTAYADITWKTKEITKPADPADPPIIFEFEGINNTNAPIKITKLEKSCGCTEITATKTELKPNESTKIITTVNPFGIGGTQRKSASIHTNDGKITELTMVLNMPLLVTFNPEKLEWVNSLDAKSIEINVATNVTIKSTKSISPDMKVEKNGNKITAIPSKLGGNGIKIEFEYKGKTFFSYYPISVKSTETIQKQEQISEVVKEITDLNTKEKDIIRYLEQNN